MKLLQLDLLAFGRFTDLRLDLSAGDHGLHIVYGANEAGKSTSLRALHALFFGIPERTTDNFKHASKDLRLGGRLRRSDGSELVFQRRKGRINTLLDADGGPIPDDSLDPFLGGMQGDMFATMFGIDHNRLIKGSQAIVQGGGEVGESLFSAGIGASGVFGVIKSLEAEADHFFLPRGQKPLINRALSEYKNAGIQLRKDQLSSREWSDHDRALAESLHKRQVLTEELVRLRAERDRIDRVVRALGTLARRAHQKERIAALGEVIVLAEDFSERRRQVVKALESAQQVFEKASVELERLRSKADGLSESPGILERAAEITELHQRLAVHRKAIADRDKRKGEIDRLRVDAEALLAQVRPDLGLPEVDSLRQSAALRARIDELVSQHGRVYGALDRAEKDLAGFETDLRDLELRLKGAEAPREASDLAGAIRVAQRQGDLDDQLTRVESDRDSERAQIENGFQRLVLKPKTTSEIERGAFPSLETIARFEDQLQALDLEEQRQCDRVETALVDAADLEGKIDALERAGEVPSEHELAHARERRDRSWALVRQSWFGAAEPDGMGDELGTDEDLAESYERRVVRADALGDRLRREADRVAAMAELRARHSWVVKEKARLEAVRGQASEELEHVRVAWQEVWAATGIVPQSAKEMRAWTLRKDALVQRMDNLKGLEAEVDRLRAAIALQSRGLSCALLELGEAQLNDGESLAALLDRASGVMTRIENENNTRRKTESQVEDLEGRIEKAMVEQKTSASAVEKWRADFETAVGIFGLGADASPREATSVMEKLNVLLGKVDEMRKLEGRVESINRDSTAFESDIRGVVDAVAPELSSLSVEAAVARLQGMLDEAVAVAADLRRYNEQKENRELEANEAKRTINLMKLRMSELCVEAGRSSPDELAEAERRSAELGEASVGLRTVEEQLVEQSGMSIDELLKEAEGAEAAQLETEISDLDVRIGEIERRQSDLDQLVGSERQILQAMDGGDRAAVAAEQAQAKLAEINAHVETFQRLRLAASILRLEVERYRAENQGPLLRRAGQLFERLTLEAFSGLEVVYDEKDRPVLEGVRSGGAQVDIGGLSDGTRDQLYLALRIASLEKYLAAGEALPFVVDDILVSFDDRRAAAALKVLGELSSMTQVLFFTHHRRLVELAVESVADVVVNHEIHV